jgi:hypothetical protein
MAPSDDRFLRRNRQEQPARYLRKKGSTLDEARRMASDALDLHVWGMIEDRGPIPEPSSLDVIMAEATNRDAVAFLVEAATKPTRSVRINVMLPEDLVEAIDRSTNNRSRFLTAAARAKLREVA